MNRNKFVAIFFSFVLLVPVIVAGVVFLQDNLDDISNKVNCFNIQEEEEDSEEETNESKFKNLANFFQVFNDNLTLGIQPQNSFYQQFQDYIGFEIQVQVPPPELI